MPEQHFVGNNCSLYSLHVAISIKRNILDERERSMMTLYNNNNNVLSSRLMTGWWCIQYPSSIISYCVYPEITRFRCYMCDVDRLRCCLRVCLGILCIL